MRTTIDKAGRLVIPAPIRAQLGLKPGTQLEAIVEDFTLRLVPAVPGPKIVRVGKRLVARPTVRPEERSTIDVGKLIEDERNRWP